MGNFATDNVRTDFMTIQTFAPQPLDPLVAFDVPIHHIQSMIRAPRDVRRIDALLIQTQDDPFVRRPAARIKNILRPPIVV